MFAHSSKAGGTNGEAPIDENDTDHVLYFLDENYPDTILPARKGY